MALNYKAVANILKEKGWIDFKPFKVESSDIEVWSYKTKDTSRTIFHFCDSEFKELDRECVQLPAGPLFLMDTPDKYSICSEGFSVEEYKQRHNIKDLVWCCLVAADNEIIHWGKGYLKLFCDLYLLGPSLIDIEDKISDKNTWEPDRCIPMYNSKENLYADNKKERITYLYDGTYRNYHFIRKYNQESEIYNFYIFDNDGNMAFEGFPILWKRSDCKLCVINLSGNENKWTLKYYDGSIKNVELNPLYKFGYGDSEDYYADDNILVIKLKHYEDYFRDENLYYNFLLIINKNREVLYFGDYNLKGSINRIINGYIIISGYRGKKMVFDSSTRLLADNVDLEHPYFVFSGGSEFCSFPDKEKDIPLLGAMKTIDMSIIVPPVYESIDIVEFEPLFVAIVGNKQYEDGKSVIKYGLYVNGIMKIPVNTEIRRLKEKKKQNEDYIVWKKDGKYGLLYQGEECLPPVYDEISWDGFVKLTKDDELGVYSKKLDFLSEIKYYDVKLLEKEKIMIADDSLYFIKDGIANLLIESDHFMEYLASDGNYHMFRDNKEYLGYKCFFISSMGNVETIEISEFDDDYYNVKISDDDGNITVVRRDLEPGSYICIYEGSYYYDTEDNCFYDFDQIVKTYDDDDYYEECPDDYDYERDTYYTLGGDDYDRFKEDGGSIDAMMDGMGF